jgi:hypothetical protein
MNTFLITKNMLTGNMVWAVCYFKESVLQNALRIIPNLDKVDGRVSNTC